MSELKNLFKGTMGFAGIAVLILFGLRFLAGEMNAGAEGFRLSLPFLIAQAAVIVGCYVVWYRKVSRTAENMMNIEKMRKMAFHYKNQYFTTSVMLTMLIAVIALICMLVGIWFVGIPALYCISSVVTMCIVGNLVLYLLMRFIGLPNQITEG